LKAMANKIPAAWVWEEILGVKSQYIPYLSTTDGPISKVGKSPPSIKITLRTSELEMLVPPPNVFAKDVDLKSRCGDCAVRKFKVEDYYG